MPASASDAADRFQVWIPGEKQIDSVVESLSLAFHLAFSSKGWEDEPVPLGEDRTNRTSARGIVHSLLHYGQQVLLANVPEQEAPETKGIVAFAFGGQLNEELIEWFQLAEFGAQPHNRHGLCPYAGVIPDFQGMRVTAEQSGDLGNGQGLEIPYGDKESLYGRLFRLRMEHMLGDCTDVYCRTRADNWRKPVQHELVDKWGFQFRGQKDVSSNGAASSAVRFFFHLQR